MAEIRFSRPWPEISCIAGNLFAELDPPCGISGGRADVLTIFGRARAGGEKIVLRIGMDGSCVYTGPPGLLTAALNGRCPEKGGCPNG